MSVCTQSQVNVMRNSIDRYISDSSRHMAIVVLHFPPEMGISQRSCYHAIFLNNWDFIYVDSLGVTTGNITEDENLRKELNEVENDEGKDKKPAGAGNDDEGGLKLKQEIDKVKLDVDAKTWIAKGFGLPIGI